MAAEVEEEGRKGQSQKSGILLHPVPLAAVQGYREEAASLQTQIDSFPPRTSH